MTPYISPRAAERKGCTDNYRALSESNAKRNAG